MEHAYCTTAEVLAEGDKPGERWLSTLLEKIETVCDWIDREIGIFIPISETRKYDGTGNADLIVDPLLAVTSIKHDSSVLSASDFLLCPSNRLWPNGPYMRISPNPDSGVLQRWTKGAEMVEITGRWGMYEDSIATGASVASQTDSSTDLAVNTGEKISPGAVLLIGDEQEYVTGYGEAVDSTANLAADMTMSDEEVTLNNGALINIGEIVKFGFEQCLIKDKAGNIAEVVRSYNGSKRAVHSSGLDVYVYRVFKVIRGANGTTTAAHVSAAISQYIAPGQIRSLCRQMTILLLEKAKSGYAGKVGNDALGETYYFNEFPKEPINKAKASFAVPYV